MAADFESKGEVVTHLALTSAKNKLLLSHHTKMEVFKMTTTELNIIAHRWMSAFNAKQLEQLLSLYDDNARHFSPKLKVRQPETQGLIKGKDAMRSWWKDAFDRLPTLTYELVRLTPFENRVFMEYIRRVAGEEDLYVGEMLEINNGLIVASSVFHR